MKLVKPGRVFKSKAGYYAANSAVLGVASVLVIVIVAVVVALAGVMVTYSVLYADKIYPGVSALDTDLGGRTEQVARATVLSRLEALANGRLAIRSTEQEWQVTLAEFGLSFDVDETIQRGYNLGREGNFVEQLGSRLVALSRGYSAEPAFVFDKGAQLARLEGIAKIIDRPAVNASLLVEPDGTFRMTPSQTGLKLDIPGSLERFSRSFSLFSTRELRLIVEDVPPAIKESDLVATRSSAQKMVAAPLTLSAVGKSWKVSEKELLTMLTFVPSVEPEAKLSAKLDGSRLAKFLEKMAKEIDEAPRNAKIEVKGGKVVVTEGAEARVLDFDASVVSINDQLARGARSADLMLTKRRPKIVAADLQEVKALAEKMIGETITLKHEQQTWTLRSADLANLMVFNNDDTGNVPKITPRFDKEGLTKLLRGVASKVDKPARDARFKFVDGKINILSDNVDGTKLDYERTVESINRAAAGNSRVVELSTEVDEAKIQSSDKDKIVIKDRLTSAKTSYAGGIAERNHNVELATSRLNGVVVPPGEVFSFNESMGPSTLASGFKIGYGIMISGTEPLTVPSVAGGICQVATTLFHAVFWAGLEVKERLPHLYWIPRYGQAPLGMKGLDATVDDPYVDFRFKNNTGNWIAIQTATDGGNVTFSIYGINTGWQVKADQPVIRNIVPADRTPVEQEDPTMPWGRTLWVESAEDGFDSSITRRVMKDGKVLDTYVVNSHFKPSRNVLLVGTKGKPPEEKDEKAQDEKAKAEKPAQ
ncbi:MAG: peptidoglycan binding domain-containing protein [Chloroflexi bacterium]|nr:peptidoglycan binding domain-containing protein [Chloroflexota bacterium]